MLSYIRKKRVPFFNVSMMAMWFVLMVFQVACDTNIADPALLANRSADIGIVFTASKDQVINDGKDSCKL